MKTTKMIISIVTAILILIASQLLSQVIANIFLMIGLPDFIANILAGILYLLLAYILVKIFCQKYLKTELEEFFIPKFKLDIKWLSAAILLPVIVSAVYLLLFNGTFVANALSFSEKLTLLSARIFFTGIAAGFVEEIIFRGIIMNVLAQKYNQKIAVLIPSVLFGVVHIIGMDFNLLSCVLVVIAGTVVGIMFSLIAIDKGSAWNSAVVHAFWNIIILGGILWIGTTADEYSVFSFVLGSNSFVLTGGEFGIESSAIAVTAYCLVSLFAFIPIKKRISQY